MGTAITLKHSNGTAVTAQEAYDAFMNTRVLIVIGNTTHEAVNMVWYDNNSSHTDTANVGYVALYCVDDLSGTVRLGVIKVGDSSLVPK